MLENANRQEPTETLKQALKLIDPHYYTPINNIYILIEFINTPHVSEKLLDAFMVAVTIPELIFHPNFAPLARCTSKYALNPELRAIASMYCDRADNVINYQYEKTKEL